MRRNFDDDDVQDVGLKFPKLDLKKDEIARGCIISPYFEVTVRHWVNRVGYVHCHALKTAKEFKDLLAIQRDGGKPEDCIMCDRALRADTQDTVNLPTVHYATYFLRYHTNVRGEVLQGQLGYHLEVWLMGNKKYKEIQSLRKEWGSLQNYDIELNCVEAKYQNFDIGLKREALWSKVGKAEQKTIIEYVKAEIERYPLMSCLGEELTVDVLKRRFLIMERRGYPDEQVDLGADAVVKSGSSEIFSEETGTETVGDETAPKDPFGLGKAGNIPDVASPEEKKEAEKVDKTGLDALIP